MQQTSKVKLYYLLEAHTLQQFFYSTKHRKQNPKETSTQAWKVP